MFLNWRAVLTIFNFEMARMWRTLGQSVASPVISTSLYFIVFGTAIGSRIGNIDGTNYGAFIVPGLIMMSVIQNSYSNVVSSFFSQRFQRSIEELLVSPVPNYVILTGFVVGGMARGLAVGAIVTTLSLFFADIKIVHPFITVTVILLTSVVFSLAGFINAVYANSFDDISIVPTFVLTPLIYLGGVFYSTQMLPPFWQVVSALNPIFYMVNTFRYGFLGSSDVDAIWAFLILGAVAVSLYGGCIWLLRHGTGIRF